MGTLAEKKLTISLTFRIQISDDVLRTRPSYLPDESDDNWQEAMEEQRRLLLALLAQGGPDLTAVLLDKIAFALSDFTNTDWEQSLLGKNSDDDEAFFEGEWCARPLRLWMRLIESFGWSAWQNATSS